MHLLDLIKSTGLPTIIALITAFAFFFVLKIRRASRKLITVLVVIASLMPVIFREVFLSWRDIDLYIQELLLSVLFVISIFISWKVFAVFTTYLSKNPSENLLPTSKTSQLAVASEEPITRYERMENIKEEMDEYDIEDSATENDEKALELGADSPGYNKESKR